MTGPCEGPVCITCSDLGEHAVVVATDGVEAQVRVQDPVQDSAARTVDVTLVDPLRPGDVVLLHAGIAIARLDPAVTTTSEVAR